MGEVFNIFATVGASEVDLAPYPGGSSTTPTGSTRKIYVAILTNATASNITLTLRIYKGATLENSFNIIVPANGTLILMTRNDSPILLIPSDRTFKAVASAASVNVLMTGFDE